MKFLNALGILLVGVVIAYFVVLGGSLAGVNDICEAYPVGTRLSDFNDIDHGWAVSAMGPYEDPKTPGVVSMIYCSAPTMCDASCKLEIENGLVTYSRLSQR